ncbi:hypothetical protein BABINDRAFT_6935 [Babjeviella inositovora NRRL Y-12698]|uniref:Uncharacterized protein n=1 Tax=Babjeviella inositovora NRRL Y-12698 TaxID=984486 RepID=A0A1E3QTT6_9ASCO|nr:uncharacterized protein BABINDRAFT_6935 [Babjeviella inositovora NRRL Y-12698]ODQ81096.1 hypothetical protein BABINDRAFT_6935 [Babjeviella inositovora NRRL Y-12698]
MREPSDASAGDKLLIFGHHSCGVKANKSHSISSNMSRKAKQKLVDKTTKFSEPTDDIESEIIEIYAQYTAAVDGEDLEDEALQLDLTIEQLPAFLGELHIPPRFIEDILRDFEAYNHYVKTTGSSVVTSETAETNAFVKARETVENFIIPDTRIVDMDKLIAQTTRLLKMRNHKEYIYTNWKMVIDTVVTETNKMESVLRPKVDLATLHSEDYEKMELNLKDLRTLKAYLKLGDKFQDVALIDMISLFANGKAHISIKDFGEIIGLLGELD